MECAYKLMEYDGKPRLKKSSGKATLPGRKQVLRRLQDGIMVGDLVAEEGDLQEGAPLIEKVMDQGRRLSPSSNPVEIAAYTKSQLQSLPEYLCKLRATPSYPVEIAPSLLRLQETAEQAIK
jgi:nicotinate phosphoribosyltransferase